MLDLEDILKDTSNTCFFSTLGVFLAIDASMLTLGSLALDDCPIDLRIPIFLVIAGSTGILGKIILLINRKLNYCVIRYGGIIANTVATVGIAKGSIATYQIYKPIFDKDLLPCCYCNEDAYWFLFVLGTLFWIFLAIVVVLSLCSLFWYCSVGRKRSNAFKSSNAKTVACNKEKCNQLQSV